MGLKGEKIIGLDAEIELPAHHGAKNLNLFGKGYPLHPWKEVDTLGEKGHDAEVAVYGLGYMGMEDLDGDRGSWDRGERVLEDDRTKGASWDFACAARSEVCGRDEVFAEGGAVDLGDGA